MTWVITAKLIDRTNSTPTGINEGPVVNGDLEPFIHRIELIGRGIRKNTQSAIIHLKTKFGVFARSAPDFMADDAQDKYLIELQITQDGTPGQLFRCQLGTPTIQNDENVGIELLVLPLEGIQLIGKEFPMSFEDELVKPKQHFINSITAYNGDKEPLNPIIGFRGGNSDTAIALPDVPKRDFLKFGITFLHDELVKILTDLSEAPLAGGVIKDFYMDSDVDPNFTLKYDIFTEEFGIVDSGVVINPLSVTPPASEKDKTIIVDNLAFKNYVIAKGHKSSGTIPTENQRFRSKETRGFLRDEWLPTKAYVIDDLVRFTDTSVTPTVVRFFKATSAVGPTATTPDEDNPNWLEDFSRLPPFSVDAFYTIGEVVTFESGGAINYFRAIADNGPSTTTPNLSGNWTSVFFARPSARYTAFFSYTPYTSNLQDFRQNMAGIDDLTITPDYIGFFPDHNIVRNNFDRENPTDEFEFISVKDIYETINTPPTGLDQRLYNGYRVLVGTSPTGVFVGHANQIAQFFRPKIPDTNNPPEFKFSKDPEVGDTINDWERGQTFRWDGVAFIAAWDITVDNDKPGVFHLVKSMQLVKGATGIPGQAVQWRHDWNPEPLLGGDVRNRSSRGVWGCFVYPYPRNTVTGGSGLGGQFGGTGTNAPPQPQFDTNNLTKTHTGLIGWLNGILAEDYGRTSNKHFKIKIGWFRSTDESIITKGVANKKIELWAHDLFGIIWRTEFPYYVNNEFQDVRPQWTIAGFQNIYLNRINELATVLGYTIPTDFFLQDIKLEGIRFDWRRIVKWGFQDKSSYSESGLYTGNYDFITKSLEEGSQQLLGDVLEFVDLIANGQWDQLFNVGFTAAAGRTDHTIVTLDDLYDEKELYAVSDDVTPNPARTKIIRIDSQRDYDALKDQAIVAKSRATFRPQQWFIKAKGDVRVRFGQKITITGDTVPGGTQELVVSEVKHLVDSDNYFMEIYAVFKYVFTP